MNEGSWVWVPRSARARICAMCSRPIDKGEGCWVKKPDGPEALCARLACGRGEEGAEE